MDQNTKRYIDTYLSIFANSTVTKTGEKFFNEGKVQLTDGNEKTDDWKLIVQDEKDQPVLIKGVVGRKIHSVCDCDYDSFGICPHQTASLLYIKNELSKEQDEETETAEELLNRDFKERDRQGRIEIVDYKEISAVSVRRISGAKTFAHFTASNPWVKIELFNLDDNTVEFIVKDRGVRSIITMQFDKGKLFIKNDISKTEYGLSNHETLLLMVLSESDSPDFFGNYFGDRRNLLYKPLYQKYGLPEDSLFQNYFKFNFDSEKGIVTELTGKGEGLLPLDVTENDPKLLELKGLVEEGSDTHVEKGRESRSLVFVLQFDSEDPEATVNIIPLIGKTSRDGGKLISHIKEYSGEHNDIYAIDKTGNTEQIISLIEQIRNLNELKQIFLLKNKILRLLASQPYVYRIDEDVVEIKKKDMRPYKVSKKPYQLTFSVESEANVLQTHTQVLIGDEIFDIEEFIAKRSDGIILSKDEVGYVASDYQMALFYRKFREPLKMIETHKDRFFDYVIRPLSHHFTMNFQKDLYDIETIELDFHKRQVFLSENNNHLMINPQVLYDNDTAVTLSHKGNVLTKEDGVIYEYKRNIELEEDFLQELSELHEEFDTQKSQGFFYLPMEAFVGNMWFYHFFEQLQAMNIEVYGLKDLKSFNYSPHKGMVSTSVRSGRDWFEINLDVRFGNTSVSVAELKRAVMKNEKYIKLKDGSVGILPQEWLHKFEKYFRNAEIVDDKLVVSKQRFSLIDELFDSVDDHEVMMEIYQKKQRLRSFKEINDVEVPANVNATLRDYQKQGLNWLNFLDEMKWGGILADDMGLGKTLQILTFVSHLKERGSGTHLVVVPTTLLFNWQNEIEKFAPHLNVLYHYGADRSNSTENFESYDMIFTSYGVLLRDIQWMKEFDFHYVILDESQSIKNPASRRFKAACLLKSKNRIALSGTPIENSTFDLYAQMNFVNSGFFGSIGNFKEQYSNPIDKEGNEVIGGELQKLVNPFVLRRTKESVASELPSKTEDVIFCEMDKAQRTVYDAYRNSYRDRLFDKIEKDGINKSKMIVLEGLTRLRQICDSPALLKDKEGGNVSESVKINEIVRHISNKTANHKILIFSQFVQMLGLIQTELQNLNINFEYLDGQSTTKQRESAVKNFQENEDLRVFLISLKAGGTGLNLTAADYVYIVDPWWNPAVESQAIDRCYRIGQAKKVFAYRMICKDTVEEKILKLQQKKTRIATDIIQTDENMMKNIDMDDIRDLFD